MYGVAMLTARLAILKIWILKQRWNQVIVGQFDDECERDMVKSGKYGESVIFEVQISLTLDDEVGLPM